MDHVLGYVLALDMTGRKVQEQLKKVQNLLIDKSIIRKIYFLSFIILKARTSVASSQRIRYVVSNKRLHTKGSRRRSQQSKSASDCEWTNQTERKHQRHDFQSSLSYLLH